MSLPIKIRFADSHDIDFIFNSWIRSYRSRVPCSKTIYCKKQHDLIKKLIAESAVIVATPSDDFELIVGYAVFEPEVLHWLYVKSSFRRMGVASELMKHSGLCDNFSYTHLPSSAIGRWFMDQGGVYNPYLLMGV